MTRSRSSRASDTLRRRGSPVRQARRATSCIPTKLPARPHTTLHFPRARLEPRCTTLFITLCFKAIRHRSLCPFQHHMSLVPESSTRRPRASMALHTLTALTALGCRCCRLGLPRCPPSLATLPQRRRLPAGKGAPLGLEVRPGCAPGPRRQPQKCLRRQSPDADTCGTDLRCASGREVCIRKVAFASSTCRALVQWAHARDPRPRLGQLQPKCVGE